MADRSSVRFLLPVISTNQGLSLLPLVVPLAKVEGAEVLLLHVRQTSYGQGVAADDEAWLEDVALRYRQKGVRVQVQQRIAHSLAGAIREVVEELEPDLLLLNWHFPGPDEDLGNPSLHDLLLDVPCNLVIWRDAEPVTELRHILIPSAGGPNARYALNLAEDLVQAYDGSLTLLSLISPAADDETLARMHQTLHDTAHERLSSKTEESLRIKVARASKPTEGILAEAGSGDYDLLMIGASQESVLNRLVFGEVPERVARQAGIPVLIVKRPAPVAVTYARRIWGGVRGRLPGLTEAEKIDVYRTIRRGARTHTDFYVMMGLSTAIASFGLLLDSPAVVIGAMLVAPLMSAIVALGLAVVQGDQRLLRIGLTTTLRGVLLALVIAFVIGLIDPIHGLTSEMQARALPNLLDLGVALAAGAAGAYALCRADVSASLPGVAIAVALVPPLATIGLALSLADWHTAAGASLLFLTNLVAIAAMGGVVFLLLGFQPEVTRPDRMRLFAQMWQVLLLLLILICLPLAWLTVRIYQDANLDEKITQTISAELSDLPDASLRQYDYDWEDDGTLVMTVEVESTRALHQNEAEEMQERLSGRLDRPVALVLKIVPTTRLDAQITPTPAIQE